jgi:hypothetical protein
MKLRLQFCWEPVIANEGGCRGAAAAKLDIMRAISRTRARLSEVDFDGKDKRVWQWLMNESPHNMKLRLQFCWEPVIANEGSSSHAWHYTCYLSVASKFVRGGFQRKQQKSVTVTYKWEPSIEKGKRKTACTVRSCCLSFQSLRLVLTTYVNADAMVGMAGVAHVESTSIEGKATNVKRHLDSVYALSTAALFGTSYCGWGKQQCLTLPVLEVVGLGGSVRLGFRRKRQKSVAVTNTWEPLVEEGKEKKGVCLSGVAISVFNIWEWLGQWWEWVELVESVNTCGLHGASSAISCLSLFSKNS